MFHEDSAGGTMDLLKLASKVCDFIRENSENEVGLFRTEKFNVDALKWSSNVCDCDDFGDFAPFMAWLDKIKGRGENGSWVYGQFERMKSLLKQDCGFYTPFFGTKVRKSPFFPAYVINNMDLTLGFEIMHRLTGEEEYKLEFIGICDSLVKHAISRKGFVLNSVIPAFNLYVPSHGCIRYKPVVSGVFAELLCDAYQMTGDYRYIEKARNLLNAFIETKAFRKYGIFPDNVYPFIYSSTGTSSLTKSNTSMISGMLRLYDATQDWALKEEIEHALLGIKSQFTSPEGCFYMSFDLKGGSVKSKIIEKGYNQPVMGNLIDAFMVLGDKEYLGMAEKCAEFWMKNQSDNGLFFERKVGQAGWYRCTLDSFADMVIIMGKLYEITGKKKYRKSVERSGRGFEFFLADNGCLYQSVDSRNGDILGRENELKFLGGALKGMLTAYTVLRGESIFKDSSKILLTRDR